MKKSRSKRKALKAKKKPSGPSYHDKIKNIFLRLGLEVLAEEVIIKDASNKDEGDVDIILKLSENSLIFIETTEGTNDLGKHFGKKCDFYKRLLENREEWLTKISACAPEVAKFIGARRADSINVYPLYASKTRLSETHLERHPDLPVLQQDILNYFEHLGGCVGKSGAFEVADFLGADDPFDQGQSSYKLEGLALSSVSQNKGSGYQIVSFYAKPSKIIPSSCVLRQASWRDQEVAFQRLMDPKRITKMRSYLSEGGEVFPTNLVVAVSGGEYKIDKDKVSITIPQIRQSVSIIDGQHRLFAYSDMGDDFNEKIVALSNEHELLVTAYMFNDETPESVQIKTQARLFLDINSKQKKVPPAIQQVIKRMCDPLSDEGIAGDLMQFLLNTNMFECDKSKISTSSIVSYSIIPLLNTSNSRATSLISQWKSLNRIQGALTDAQKAQYLEFLKSTLGGVFASWVNMVKGAGELVLNLNKSKALTGVGIGGVFYAMKHLIEHSDSALKDVVIAGGDKIFDGVKFSYSPEVFNYSSNGRIAHGAALKDAIVTVKTGG